MREHYGRKFLMFGVTFAVMQRVPTLHLDDEWVKEAQGLSPMTWLPTPKDMTRIRACMVEVVKRIIVQYVEHYADMGRTLQKHIPHKHHREMHHKTQVISVGVVNEDPAANSDVIKIMEELQKVCPLVDNKPLRIPCNGDQMSFERMANLKRARVTSRTKTAQLNALVETPKSFTRKGCSCR